MRDHILIVRHSGTGLFHAELYRNRPTPSGRDRPILSLSTTDGKPSAQEALDLMRSGLTSQYLEQVDMPVLEAATPADRIPRRIRVDKMTQAELAIREAIHAVEQAGCDERLTKAVMLLDQAKNVVADFVDGMPLVER